MLARPRRARRRRHRCDDAAGPRLAAGPGARAVAALLAYLAPVITVHPDDLDPTLEPTGTRPRSRRRRSTATTGRSWTCPPRAASLVDRHWCGELTQRHGHRAEGLQQRQLAPEQVTRRRSGGGWPTRQAGPGGPWWWQGGRRHQVDSAVGSPVTRGAARRSPCRRRARGRRCLRRSARRPRRRSR